MRLAALSLQPVHWQFLILSQSQRLFKFSNHRTLSLAHSPAGLRVGVTPSGPLRQLAAGLPAMVHSTTVLHVVHEGDP